jgi:hypothetical protein
MSGKRLADLVILLAGLAGLALSIYAYTWPHGGVSGTAGALLACFGHAALIVAAALFLLSPAADRWFGGLGTFLLVLGAAGTALAGYMLMWPSIAWAGVVALAAALCRPSARRMVL